MMSLALESAGKVTSPILIFVSTSTLASGLFTANFAIVPEMFNATSTAFSSATWSNEPEPVILMPIVTSTVTVVTSAST